MLIASTEKKHKNCYGSYTVEVKIYVRITDGMKVCNGLTPMNITSKAIALIEV